MDAHLLNTIANFIWGIADDCLRDVYVRGKYRDVILPMTVIREHHQPVGRAVQRRRAGLLQCVALLPARFDRPLCRPEAQDGL